jgi:hypothetical protein
MVVHVVLMRLLPGVSRVALDELARHLGDLAESVAGPNSYVVGPNITEACDLTPARCPGTKSQA